MPSASSCLMHAFCFAENPYQTESKWDKNLRRFSWNICEFWEVESTRDDARGAHEGEGGAPGGRACPGPSWPLLKAVGALLLPQESQYPDKNRLQISAQSELRISGNLRNSERAQSGTQKQKETERQIQSRRGSRSSAAMEAMDQGVNPSPI